MNRTSRLVDLRPEAGRHGILGVEVPITVVGQRNYGESQVPPFCAQFELSMSMVSGTPE
jgi:hypothetical protein